MGRVAGQHKRRVLEEVLPAEVGASTVRILAGDKVSLELTPYGLGKARITFRHKDERPPPCGQRRAPAYARR